VRSSGRLRRGQNRSARARDFKPTSTIRRMNGDAGGKPNDQKLSHAAGDFRQPETRSEN